jgi:hypothetical protein
MSYRRVFTIDERNELFYKGELIPWNYIVAYRRLKGCSGPYADAHVQRSTSLTGIVFQFTRT